MPRRGSPGRVALLVVILVVVGAAALWLLSRRQGDALGSTASTVQQASVDAITTAKVKTALALSQRVSAFAVDVDSADGVVTLTGDVTSQETRQLAEEIARETSGVREVRNRLRVDPGVQPDADAQRLALRMADLEVKAAVQEALLADPELREAGVTVTVEEGLVRLEGQVSGAEQRLRAELAARGVDRVGAVDNALTVLESTSPADRDLELAEAVEFALYSSRAFDLEPIVIAASAGAVRLEGPVRSRAELLLAERIAAEVEGVETVANALEVRPPDAPEPPAAPRDDTLP